jgi:uncharacterized membrane protein YeaQ/YmgE (transglycosylase-associated protein family)
MLATISDTYTWLPVIIMIVAGILGGTINNFLASDAGSDGNKLNVWRSVVIGIGAALLVPLFLNMISSNLMSDVVGSKEKPGDFGKALVFLGFCLVAAISSRAFIQTISDRLLNEVKKTATEAKLEAQDAQTKVGQVVDLVVEPDEPSAKTEPITAQATQAAPLTDDEKKILDALADGRWLLRSTTGVINDSKVNPAEIDDLLGKLGNKGFVGQTKSPGGVRWYITSEGREAIKPNS